MPEKQSVNTNSNQTVKMGFQSIPVYIWFMLIVFVSGMVLFLAFRLALLFLNYEQVKDVPLNIVMYAVFNRGSLFDSVVNSYILIIPFLWLSFAYIFKVKKGWFYSLTVIVINVFYVISISLMSLDIPYFSYFNSRLTNGVLSWFDELWLSVYARFSVPVYYPYLFASIAISVLFCFWIRYVARKTIYHPNGRSDSFTKKIFVFAFVGVLLFFGIRGEYRTNDLPLNVSNSFFSDYSLPNQIGLNPIYSFVSSFKPKNKELFKNNNFIELTQKYLNIKRQYDSPVARDVNFNLRASANPNVVLFIVESLSAVKFKRYGYKENIMPFMDSLANVSASFDNVYTSCVHTYDGIYSTLFSMPTGLNIKAMTNPVTTSQKHSGISNVLKQNGYHTAFFCTGNKQFDNVDDFLSYNDFDDIYSQDNYPPEFNVTEWGVPDHVMFDYSLNKFNEFYKSGKPFFASYMTVSTHESIAIPDWVNFKPSSNDEYDRRYQYFDWSVSEFMKAAQNTEWFDNTIFVFIADHGQNFEQTYDMSLSYHHTPLIMYAPKLISPQRFEKPGLQIDMFPTLMGYLQIPYVNNTLGVDLRNEGRKYAYFCTDNKIGCLNDDYFLVLRSDGPNSLYKYKNKDRNNYIKENQELVNEMKRYATAMIQTSYWLGEHNLLSLPEYKHYRSIAKED
ncbi:MAG: LTA synthase family protein [Candidatus Kapaibacterium sp.]